MIPVSGCSIEDNLQICNVFLSFVSQSEDTDVEVKDTDSILVAQQGEQDAATATIMASVDQQDGMSKILFYFHSQE